MPSAEIGTFHHVGMAVHRIAESATALTALFGATVETPVIHDPNQGVRIQFIRLGGLRMELLEPAASPSPLDGVLRRGIAIYHIGYETPDLDGALARCVGEGWQVTSSPRPAAAFDGRRVAFMMRQGMMIELIERSGAAE